MTYAPITFILAGAMAFGRVLTIMQAPQEIAMMITSFVSSKGGVLIVINISPVSYTHLTCKAIERK